MDYTAMVYIVTVYIVMAYIVIVLSAVRHLTDGLQLEHPLTKL